jgi:hypothetical protein
MQGTMHAYLFTGSIATIRQNEIQKCITKHRIRQADTLLLTSEQNHFGIDTVRSFHKLLLLTPLVSSYRAGIIYEANRMTVESQNALLKLLEEPPPRAIIFLETSSADLLLPTVVSRCEHIICKQQKSTVVQPKTKEMLMTFISSSVGQRLVLMDTVTKDKKSADLWVSDAIETARLMLIASVKEKTYKKTALLLTLIRNLIKAKHYLGVNVNPKLACDLSMLTL